MRIQPDKLQEIYAECLKVKSKKSLSRKAFQSLLGRLLYIKKCVTASRTFINRILALFRSSPGQRIHLTHEFYQDIDWFLKFLPIYNGISCIKKVTSIRDALKSVLSHLGIPLEGHGFHTFRRSGATLAFDNNVQLQDIMAHGLWRSSAIWSYLQSSSLAPSIIPTTFSSVV